MDLRPEMMLCVVAIIEPGPVVELAVSAYTPRDRLVRITAVMPIITIQIKQAVAKVPERQNETDVIAVENAEDNKVPDERRQFENAPKRLALIFPFQFLQNGLGIFTKEAEEGIRERMFRFAFVAMFVNGNPIHGLTNLVRTVGVSLVMLH